MRIGLVTMQTILVALLLSAIGCAVSGTSATRSEVDLRLLAPGSQETESAGKGLQTAVFAGGCFWGVEAVFEHVKGVTDARSGYTGGTKEDANYDRVSDGKTGHAEAVKVTYDPAKVSYVQLLTVFFSVAHDSTEVNRQGPDVGPQYRSEIFYVAEEQKKLAVDYIAAIEKAKVLAKPVATKVSPLTEFFEAEKYHQDFMKKNPDHPYIVHHDVPKIAALKERFPDLFVERK
jgi:peptide-methionine (S)-S-oxide reductase